MIRLLGPLALAGLLLLPAAGRSQQAAPDPALALLRSSGMYEQLGLLAAAVEQQLQAQYPSMPLAARANLVNAMRVAYEPASLREAARGRLAQRMDPAQLTRVNAWLGSAQGKRVTRLEEEASAPEAIRKMQAYAATLQMQPPAVDRISLMQDLDRLTGSSELAIQVAIQTAGAVARGMGAASARPVDAAEIDKAIEAQRPTLKAALEQSTLVSMLYTYQSLSAQEMGSYLSFLASPAGRWYHEVMTEAMFAALDQANVRLETQLGGTQRGSRPASIAR